MELSQIEVFSKVVFGSLGKRVNLFCFLTGETVASDSMYSSAPLALHDGNPTFTICCTCGSSKLWSLAFTLCVSVVDCVVKYGEFGVCLSCFSET
jgi:hypothetical protein